LLAADGMPATSIEKRSATIFLRLHSGAEDHLSAPPAKFSLAIIWWRPRATFAKSAIGIFPSPKWRTARKKNGASCFARIVRSNPRPLDERCAAWRLLKRRYRFFRGCRHHEPPHEAARHTCSIGFEEKEFNEAEYARQVAKLFHSEHHEETVRPNALEIMDKLVWHYDEPFADSSAIPTYYVQKSLGDT